MLEDHRPTVLTERSRGEWQQRGGGHVRDFGIHASRVPQSLSFHSSRTEAEEYVELEQFNR